MNYIARGYVSLSEEHHRSRSPALSLRVRARIFFFFPSFLFLPSLFFTSSPSPPFSPAPSHLIPTAPRLSMENHSCQWSPAHVTSRSPSSYHRISVGFFLFLHPPHPLSVCSFSFSRFWAQLVVRNNFCLLLR